MIPETANRKDWPRLVANAVNELIREVNSMANQSESKTAFGDSMTTTLSPRVELKATYGIRVEAEVFSGSTGSVTATDAEFVLQTGVGIGGYGVLWSRRPLVYIPGNGAECRITARFTPGVALSLQTCGMFSAINGMFFGYNGTSFGVMHRYGGGLEIRTLQITAASGSSVTATVTLNGTAYNVSVTSKASVQAAAHQLETALLATGAAALWNISHIDDKIVFQFKGAGSQAGAYSLSVSGGTMAGTFTQQKAGAMPTETWTPQSEWNVDTMGWLDQTKGNIYKMEYAYLGYGPLKFSIFDPSTNAFKLAHVIKWSNANIIPNFNNPSMRPGWVAASLGSTTNLTVAGASAMGAIQGDAKNGVPFGTAATATGVSTETQVLSIKVRNTFNGRTLNGIALPQSMVISTDSGKGAIFKVRLNATVAGDTIHNYVDEGESIMTYDKDGTTVAGGRELGDYALGPNGSIPIDFSGQRVDLIAGDELTVTAQVTSGAASDMTVSLTWIELV